MVDDASKTTTEALKMDGKSAPVNFGPNINPLGKVLMKLEDQLYRSHLYFVIDRGFKVVLTLAALKYLGTW